MALNVPIQVAIPSIIGCALEKIAAKKKNLSFVTIEIVSKTHEY